MTLHNHWVNEVTELDQAEMNELFRGAGEVNDGSLILANNRFLQGEDTGLTIRSLLGVNGSNQVTVGYTGQTLVIPGTASTVFTLANNVAWNGLDNGAVSRNLIGINASNLLTIGAATLDMSLLGAKITTHPPIANNVPLQGLTAAAAAVDLIRINASDAVIVGGTSQAFSIIGTQIAAWPPLVNDVALRSKDNGGTNRDLIQMSATNIIEVGYTGSSSKILGSAFEVATPMSVTGGVLTLSSSLDLANTFFVRSLDSGAVNRQILGVTAGNICQVGNANLTLSLLGDLTGNLTTANNVAIRSDDSGGTPRQLMRMRSDNVMEFGESGFTFTFAGTFDMSPADRAMDNNTFLTGENTSAVTKNLLGINGSNVILLGDGSVPMTVQSTVNGLTLTSGNYITSGSVNLIRRTALLTADAVEIGQTGARNWMRGMMYFDDNQSLFWINAAGTSATRVLEAEEGAGIIVGQDQYDIYLLPGDSVFVGSATPMVNGFQSKGITIDNETDEALTFQHVGGSVHGLNTTEDDTFGFLRAIDSNHGLELTGIGSGATQAVQITSDAFADATSVSTSVKGGVHIRSRKISGTGFINHGTGAVLLSIANNATTRFAFLEDGTAQADVAWSTFDDHDDVALVRALNGAGVDPLGQIFDSLTQSQRDTLEKTGVFQFHPDRPGGWLNWSKAFMLLFGTILQMDSRLRQAEQQLYG